MNDQKFYFRRFLDSDANDDEFYFAFVNHAIENIQPYFWGPSVVSPRDKFMKGACEYSHKVHHPPFIADAIDNKLFGVYHMTFRNANRYHQLSLHLWDKFHLVEPILKQIINQTFSRERLDDCLLMEIPEFLLDQKVAAESLGLRCVGTFPRFLCHGRKYYDKYFYYITAREWYLKPKD